MRDLEIRGAGDLLGAEQSGHVAAVGFELYVELLREAVAELSGQRRAAARPVRVDARVDAYVPAAYIASEALKIDLHRRLALAENDDELRELHAATEDRYGPRPGAGREPVRDPGGEAEARADRRRLPRLPRRAAHRRPARARLGRAPRPARTGSPPPSTRTGNREVSLRTDEFSGATAAGRCYPGRAPGGLKARGFFCAQDPLLILVLALLGLGLAACGGDDERAGGRGRGRRRPGVTKTEFDALMARAKRLRAATSASSRRPGTPEYKTLQNQAVQYLVQRASRAEGGGARHRGRRARRSTSGWSRSRSSTSTATTQVPGER